MDPFKYPNKQRPPRRQSSLKGAAAVVRWLCLFANKAYIKPLLAPCQGTCPSKLSQKMRHKPARWLLVISLASSTSSRAGLFVREKPLPILVAPSAALAALAPPSFLYLTACILVNGVLREDGASNLLAVAHLSFVLKRICIPDYAQDNVDQHT